MKLKKKTNYEGFKTLDKALEKIDNGTAPTPREYNKQILCPLCHRYTSKKTMIRSELLGETHSDSPFTFKYIIGCDDCAEMMTQVERPSQDIIQAKENTSDAVDIGGGIKVQKHKKE